MKFLLPLLALFALQTAVPTAQMRAETPPVTPTEAQVKAQIILNLPLVADWPPGALPADKRVRLCTLSENDVSRHLQAMASKEPYLQNILFIPAVAVPDVASCRVLYIDVTDSKILPQILAQTQGLPLLTVGNTPKFARRGGMIGFLSTEKTIGLFSQKNVRFEINLTTTAAAGITLDPLLLELAEKLIAPRRR